MVPPPTDIPAECCKYEATPVMVFELGRLIVPPAVKLSPLAVSAVLPLELMTTLPVVVPPTVKSAALVVARFPLPVKYVATGTVPEILAVGVPVLTPVNANLAEVVAVAPIKRSTVLLRG